MLDRLILQIIAGILGIWLAVHFVAGVILEVIPGKSEFLGIALTERWQVFVLVGSVLGLVNFFIKPVLQAITLPLRILTLGLFGLIINILLVWVVKVIFPELTILGLTPLFWTTIIVWGVSFFLNFYR